MNESGEFSSYPRLAKTIAGKNPQIVVSQLKPIMKKLGLKHTKDIEKAWRSYQTSGSFYKIPKKPLMYDILNVLEKEGADRFKELNTKEFAEEISRKLKTNKSSVRQNLFEIHKIFRSTDLSEIINDWKTFKNTGNLPARFLSKKIPLSRVEMEILKFLSENPDKYKMLFDKQNYTVLARELFKQNMKTTDSEGSVQNRMADLKNKFNAENLDELLKKSDTLDKEGKINLGYLSKKMPLNRVEMEILELLSKHPDKYKVLFETNILALTRELFKQNMKTTDSEGSVREGLTSLKIKFNTESLDGLLKKSDKLNKKGGVNLGYLSKKMPLLIGA